MDELCIAHCWRFVTEHEPQAIVTYIRCDNCGHTATGLDLLGIDLKKVAADSASVCSHEWHEITHYGQPGTGFDQCAKCGETRDTPTVSDE